MNNYPEKLNLDLAFRIREESFKVLVSIISEICPKKILEFGSGASSVRLANAFPQAQIIATENTEEFYRATSDLKNKYLKQNNLSIRYAPLRFQMFDLRAYYSYQKIFLSNNSINAIIVDGPRTALTLRGREACLYQVYEKITVPGIVILDDYEREAEQQIVKNWMAVYPHSFCLTVVDTGHRLAVMRKEKSVAPNRLVGSVMKDNVKTNLYLGLRWSSNRLRRLKNFISAKNSIRNTNMNRPTE